MPTLDFINKEDEKAIVAAIELAEENTRGEIRIHIEKQTNLEPIKRAEQIFQELKMDATELRNGVLFYVGVENHSFAIIGDKGINDVVPADFWESTKDLVIENFKKQAYREGLIAGVLKAGEQLKKFFPSTDNNPNELTNEISRG
uniref:TPM domain-containing protein n=1 Tax=Flavobacterium sp. TaxID=239 RepID=UPI004049B008